ncbi:hypothetical protein FIE12Z_10049 [Fusarium flagelliforme]|uniref:Uncharacterized protein n=1 Tax=Fusarium flagelliforme TaxID=2675880 RepID=A0A395MCT1_9HYPO|nr:hypothetical protein FIE12Z_10049 [Fusarium flagelliforme]
MSRPDEPRPAHSGVEQPQSFELPMRGETLNASDLEGQLKVQDEPKGWFRMSRQQQRDPRQMVYPRCTEIYAYCLGHLVNRVDSLYAAVQKAHEAGEEAPELSNKLVETTMRYGKMMIQTNQILGLSQPKSRYLGKLLNNMRDILEDENVRFLDEPAHDWASLKPQDKMDQLITLALTTKVGKVLARLQGSWRIFYAATEL